MSIRFRALAALATLIVSTLVGVAIAEFGLRWLGNAGQSGYPDYGDTIRDGLLKPDFSAEVVGGSGEPVLWTNNSAGFRSTREFTRAPRPGTLRILSLGDSFTAGYRVDNEETFSRRIEDWLNQTLGPTEVLINGVEEPANGLRYLREEGLTWSPHFLLFGVTLGNDIAQSYIARHPTTIGFRQGLEEVELPPQSLHETGLRTSLARRLYYASLRSRVLALVRPRRAIASWYGHVYPPKLFDAINGFGVFLATPPRQVRDAYQRLFAILEEVRDLCDAYGIGMAIAVFPQRFQVQTEDWRSAVSAYGLEEQAFDLGGPNARIARFCRESGIPCIDPTDFMRRRRNETGNEYYFPLGDMHWNADGHQLWAQGARETLLPLLSPIAARLGEEPAIGSAN
jgi:hypothetical protein